ncbi:MAG: hypothetical protein BJ554DRAFT_6211 [Olpidium bornovanus]|uniref:Zinc-finger domain-containing protein n=1 Tax=Olpidium bornovanus TaxID=278681 RepID=A0A8H8DKD9_9FUNG|nr:MAG: hypothetical protein BJ554DRAFT_6211 [Olpidium bornovanus]
MLHCSTCSQNAYCGKCMWTAYGERIYELARLKTWDCHACRKECKCSDCKNCPDNVPRDDLKPEAFRPRDAFYEAPDPERFRLSVFDTIRAEWQESATRKEPFIRQQTGGESSSSNGRPGQTGTETSGAGDLPMTGAELSAAVPPPSLEPLESAARPPGCQADPPIVSKTALTATRQLPSKPEARLHRSRTRGSAEDLRAAAVGGHVDEEAPAAKRRTVKKTQTAATSAQPEAMDCGEFDFPDQPFRVWSPDRLRNGDGKLPAPRRRGRASADNSLRRVTRGQTAARQAASSPRSTNTQKEPAQSFPATADPHGPASAGNVNHPAFMPNMTDAARVNIIAQQLRRYFSEKGLNRSQAALQEAVAGDASEFARPTAADRLAEFMAMQKMVCDFFGAGHPLARAIVEDLAENGAGFLAGD